MASNPNDWSADDDSLAAIDDLLQSLEIDRAVTAAKISMAPAPQVLTATPPAIEPVAEQPAVDPRLSDVIPNDSPTLWKGQIHASS